MVMAMLNRFSYASNNEKQKNQSETWNKIKAIVESVDYSDNSARWLQTKIP